MFSFKSKIQEEYLSTIEKQNQKLHDMQHTCNCLKIKLANSEEHNDLLEFQILELREMSKDVSVRFLNVKNVSMFQKKLILFF